MGLRDNYKAAYINYGNEFTIIRNAGNVSGEYLEFKVNSQATKPQIRETFLDAFIPFDSSGEAGDVIQMGDINTTTHLLMNKSPEVVEKKTVRQSIVLYKVNSTGSISRPSTSKDAAGAAVSVFTEIEGNAYAVQRESLYGNRQENEDIGHIDMELDELFLPRSYGIQMGDRWLPSSGGNSGEVFIVQNVKKGDFTAIDVAMITSDTR